MTMKRTFLVAAVALVLTAAGGVEAGRYSAFTNRAARGPHMDVVAATYFGSQSLEAFIDAGSLPGGRIVAFGNAWGPQFPDAVEPTVLGSGEHRGLDHGTGRRGPSLENPDIAGMLVFYNNDLSRVQRVVRFDWGVASLSRGAVGPDGDAIYIAGRATEAFRDVARRARVFNTQQPPEAEGRGAYEYEGVTVPGDVFLARLDASGRRFEWVWVLEGMRNPPRELWVDAEGALYADLDGLRRVSPDGRSIDRLATAWGEDNRDRHLRSGGPRSYLAVHPRDGSYYFGGDRNTHTGRQPWRQPFLYGFNSAGERQFVLWEWPPRDHACGGGGSGLCSDSSPRVMDFDGDGNFIVGGWSDGGNSVFGRQPTDIDRTRPSSRFGMSAWGMRAANSLTHIMRIEPETLDVIDYNLWVAYVPMTFDSQRHRGAPNHAGISQLIALGDGAVAFTGGAATGLIQTPNAFYEHPDDGRRYGGRYAAVFSADFGSLLFSSYLPGCDDVRLGRARDGLLVVSRSRGDDGRDDGATPTPTVNAVQEDKRGEWDAHIILLSSPQQNQGAARR